MAAIFLSSYCRVRVVLASTGERTYLNSCVRHTRRRPQ